jgi:iron-sulfur cluster repair protein YtfE (RIC family)
MPPELEQALADPLLTLTGDHGKLRGHLHSLVRAGRLLALGRGDAHQTLEIGRALRFFAIEVPLHAADEEDSLLPRLRARLKPRESHFAYLLHHLERDHAELAAMHRGLDELGRALAACIPLEGRAERQKLEPALARFRASVTAILRIYDGHMRVEERDIFPAIRVILTQAEREAMAREMAARRA